MSRVMSQQLVSSSVGEAKRQGRAVTATLWTVQILLALIFLFAGSMKLILPIEMMTAQMPLPGLTHIQRSLTPLAACGLVVIMVGAVVLTLASQGVAGAVVPLVVGGLAACVAYGRRSWAARA